MRRTTGWIHPAPVALVRAAGASCGRPATPKGEAPPTSGPYAQGRGGTGSPLRRTGTDPRPPDHSHRWRGPLLS